MWCICIPSYDGFRCHCDMWTFFKKSCWMSIKKIIKKKTDFSCIFFYSQILKFSPIFLKFRPRACFVFQKLLQILHLSSISLSLSLCEFPFFLPLFLTPFLLSPPSFLLYSLHNHARSHYCVPTIMDMFGKTY